MSTKFSGIWIGEKDLTRDEEFLRDAQNEVQSPSIVEALGEREVADQVGGN